jgi:methyl acetate hydrolase
MIAEPGEKFEYGISMDWAGKMVEAVSGQKLGVFMRENIFEPLGMASTAFKITPDMETRRAWLHTRGEDGTLEPYDFVKPQDPEFEEGGGGLYSTCRDYTRFTRMMLNNGELDGLRIISPETVALMSRNAIGDLSVGPLKTVMPDLSNDCEFFPRQRKTWGLSFMINEEKAPAGRSAGSLSWAGLSNVYFWIDPKEDIAGTFMTQMLPFADGPSVDAFLKFEKKVYELSH